jgi:hypothetical protein
MSVILQRELGRLNGELLRLAGLAEQAMRKALQALRQRDAALAREVVEADGQIDREENRINEECLKVLALHQPVACDLRRVTAALMVATDLERIADLAVNLAGYYADRPSAARAPADPEALAARFAEAAVHSALLRDVLGYPFRPAPALDPAWLAWNDGCVVKLASGIYQERDFSAERMGVLADALEDAGVTNEEVLGHLRGPGPHCRGCWVVDLVLDKE